MTDDKGAGEGPYKVIIDEFRRSCLVYPNGFVCRSLGPDAYTLCSDLNSAYSRGRKAERERCAKIAEDHALLLNSPGEAAACREVAEMIRGGQDEK